MHIVLSEDLKCQLREASKAMGVPQRLLVEHALRTLFDQTGAINIQLVYRRPTTNRPSTDHKATTNPPAPAQSPTKEAPQATQKRTQKGSPGVYKPPGLDTSKWPRRTLDGVLQLQNPFNGTWFDASEAEIAETENALFEDA